MNRIICLMLTLIYFNQPILFAENLKFTPRNRSPEELMRFVKRAVALVHEKGEAAYEELTDPNGPWVKGDFYIYINDLKGNVIAHRIKKLEGKNLYGIRDVNGKPFVAMGQEIVRSKRGYGWLDWWWPKPGESEPSHKVGFVMRVPGKRIFVGSAIYDMDPVEIEKIFEEQSHSY